MYAAATGWVLLFSTLGSLSLGQVALHHATEKQSDEWVNETVGTLLGLTAIVTIAAWILCAALFVATGGDVFHNLPALPLTVAFLALPFVLWFDTGRYVLYSLGKVSAFNRSQVIGYSAGIAFLVPVVIFPKLGLTGALVAWLVLYVTMAGWGYVSLRAAAREPRFSRGLARQFLGGSVKLHLTTVGTYIHLQSSVLILNYYRSPAETGYYQLATQVLALGTLAPMAVSTYTYALVSRAGPDSAWGEQRRLLALAFAFSALAVLVGYFLVPYGITLLAGSDFAPSIPLVRLLLLSLFGMTVSIVMASQWIGRGFFVQTTVLSVIAGVASLALDFRLIPRYGMYGALVSTLVVYAIALVANGSLAVWIERRWREVMR